jgi:hypothetical protein
MSRVKLLGLSLVLAALGTLGFGVRDSVASGNGCNIYSAGSFCHAAPGGTCCYTAGHRLLRCDCNQYGYCSWNDTGSSC